MKSAVGLILACSLSNAAAAQSIDVATLRLPDVCLAAFAPATVVRLPRSSRSSRIEVRFPPSSAAGRLDLYLDDTRLTTRSYSEGDAMVMVAQATEAAGLLGDTTQVIQVVRFGRTRETIAEWRLARWTGAYVEASRSSTGRAPELRIDDPAGGTFVFLTRPPSITVKGRILTPGDIVVRAAGIDAKQVAGDPSFVVDLPLAATVTEIEVVAQDRISGATRQLILPITASRPR